MKREIIPYNPILKERARDLGNQSTFTEVMVWQQLKHKQMLGYDFHRQKPLGNYIVDFFCNELMLAIEIDGECHVCKELSDAQRQKELEKLGIHFLRFTDMEIIHNLEYVMRKIENWIKEKTA